MCSVFDNEEVGSGTKQGAGSTFGADVLNTMLLRNIRQTQDRQRRKRQPTSMRGRSEMNWEAVWIYWRKMHTASAISMISQ